MKKYLVVVFAVLGSVALHAEAAMDVQSWTLDNGARVLFVENHALPIIDVNVDFDAGSRRDNALKPGVAAMTNTLLTRGVDPSATEPALTESSILDGFADIVAQYGNGAGLDKGGVSMRVLSETVGRKAAMTLLARILATPSFPQEALVRDKARMIAGLKEAETKPENIGSKAFLKALYGTHPYAYDMTPASVEAMTRDDLVAFHRTHYVANRAVIAMIGDVTRDEAHRIATQLTAKLPQGATLPAMDKVPAATGSDKRIAHPASQSHIMIGMPTIAYGDPDFFPLTVGNYILGGGGFVSRLMQEVREKRGLTYGVSSGFSPLAQEGPFQIGLQTQQAQTALALQVTRDTLATFLRDGPTAAEVQAAKDNLIGGFALRLDSNSKIIDNLALIGYYNLPLNYLDTWSDKVNNVDIAQIKAAFARKVHIDKLTTVVVGQAQ